MEANEPTEKEGRYQAAKRATLIAAAVNVSLSVGKIAAGVFGNSAAMLADGIHSASDLVTDAVVLITMRISRQEADDDHPYGHGKFETIATQFISLILLVVAGGIMVDAAERLRSPELSPPAFIALAAALVSLISKEALFQYTIRLGRKLNAKALIANAWHQRSDAISSIAALIGIGGAMMGYPILDPLAAIAVALILGKVGLELFRDALRELTDSAIDEEVHKEITALVDADPQVRSAHFLKARRMGPDLFAEVHVVVNPFLSVSEGHQIADRIRLKLTQEVEGLTDVLVHVDSEEDQHGIAVPIMSLRASLWEDVTRAVEGLEKPLVPHAITPHYTPEGIVLDLVLKADAKLSRETVDALAGEASRQLVFSHPEIISLRPTLYLGEIAQSRQS